MKLPTRRILYLLLIILVIGGIFTLILVKGPLAPVSVKTTLLQTGDLQPAVFGVGTVQARRSYNIGFTRAGRLLSLNVDLGDLVKKGQLLGKLDPVDLPQRIRSAGLTLLKTEHQIIASQAVLSEAQERAQQAQKEMIRYQDLVAKKQVSQELADNRASDARAAQDKVSGAAANLDGNKHDYERMQEDIRALKAQMAELNLISPTNGLIIARNIEPGSVVPATATVLNLVDPASLWVAVRIDQAMSGSIQAGQPVDIELRNQPGEWLTGKVIRLELIADNLTEERMVDIAFDTVPENIAIGMLVNATIHLPAVNNAHWLPAASIVFQQGQAGVWRVQDKKVQFGPVTTGIKTLDGKIQILQGVGAQDVIVHYADKPLSEGKKVKLQAGHTP